MHLQHRHQWDLTPQAAISLQHQLAQEIIADRPIDLSTIHYIAGVDVSVKNNVSHAAIVVLTYPGLQLIETACHQMCTPFPYIPGLLSFREGPVLVKAFEKLQQEPDLFIFDGMGLAHPRRIGLACHMGLWLQKPTIGCGKTLFVGEYVEPDQEKGKFTPLIDRGETIGVTLRTRSQVKPIFISVGHLADLASSISIVVSCTTRYRLPEPIRLAHQAAGKFLPSSPS